MQKKQLLHKKPGYFRGQLLLEDDFIAEQRYHSHARYRHALNMHGWGVVRGLEVVRIDETTIAVSPGIAVDGHGHEIELLHEERLSLAAIAAQSLVAISLVYAEEGAAEAADEAGQRVRNCYGVLSASVGVAEAAVVLATVQLNERGHVVDHHAIGLANRRLLRTPLEPGSVTAAALDEHLRVGWLRMPFRPMPIPREGDEEPPPPFRVGPTEARAHRDYDGRANTRGAAGSMAIALPPGVTRVLRLRIAGEENDARMQIELMIGGWDPEKRKHVLRNLLKVDLKGGSFDNTWQIDRGELHTETSTLALEIRCEGYARVSLVAIQVTCDPRALQASMPAS
ncbi:hypothetical protein [Paraburkholderia sp. GAS42]|jgi:hypothetical protein|uniref:hypothetical protein n=1 Tax=Paraburkholderia sp. GAS42 TaxID=3035135 RepID=UPI003D220E0B